ncbi:MAG: TetR family transcriptional regulator [Aeromicrobium sp.]|nr:TetR family transcriptional regulator [Aeromicrobium sp.]
MSKDWLGDKRSEFAAEHILDAAANLFAEHGPTGVGMNDVAAAAGCSRATVYRYFENRRVLHVAFVNREALRLAQLIRERTAHISDPEERLVTAVMAALELVRCTPALAAWFEIGDADLASELASSSAVIEAISAAFLAHLGGTVSDNSRKARWTVRSILSLLTIPDPDERALIEEFVVPVLLARAPAPAGR